MPSSDATVTMTTSSATSRSRLSVRPSIAPTEPLSTSDQVDPGRELVKTELLGALEHCRLGAPAQHAGLDGLDLAVQVVAQAVELADVVVSGRELNGLGEIDQADKEGHQDGREQDAHRMSTPTGAVGPRDPSAGCGERATALARGKANSAFPQAGERPGARDRGHRA